MTLRLLLSAALALCAATAHADIFYVGAAAGGCAHQTIQSAVNAAAGNGVPDTIRVTRTQTYTAQQVVVNTGEDLSIVGGFATCASTVSDSTQTEISGAGGDTLPVFDLRSPTDSTIRFRLLRITGGDQDGDGSGGGINYVGVGRVELIQTTVDGNHAARGGGIYFEGVGNNAELLISNDNFISGNEATSHGGGIFLFNGDMTMNAPRSAIAFNKAANSGGGLYLVGAGPKTTARVGTGGIPGIGDLPGIAAIYGNEADIGGGVALEGRDQGTTYADFYLATVDAAAPASISDNFARVRGGAIHLQPVRNSGVVGEATATLTGAIIEKNGAPDGAAVYANTETFFTDPQRSEFRMDGGHIRDNRSANVGGTPTNGPLIVVGKESSAVLKQVRVTGNDGGPVLHARSPGVIHFSDSLIADNVVRGRLLESLDTEYILYVDGTTIAGNAISTGPVIYTDFNADLRRLIIWQPGVVTLHAVHADVDDIHASELASLPTDHTYGNTDPRFLDPANGDYRLQAASPAVDVSGAAETPGVDGLPHGVDLERVENQPGISDLGAFERQTLGNLVLNPGFIEDLHLWNPGTPGSSATRIAAGESSVGAATVSMQSAPGGEFVGLTQCVRMPGPGFWRVSGFAYAPGADPLTRDRVSMRWRLLYDTDDETCNGALGAEGNIAFPNGTAFAKREDIVVIDPARFTADTAIEVQLRVREGSLNLNATTTGHFDGIVVETSDIPPSALPFRNGFE